MNNFSTWAKQSYASIPFVYRVVSVVVLVAMIGSLSLLSSSWMQGNMFFNQKQGDIKLTLKLNDTTITEVSEGTPFFADINIDWATSGRDTIAAAEFVIATDGMLSRSMDAISIEGLSSTGYTIIEDSNHENQLRFIVFPKDPLNDAWQPNNGMVAQIKFLPKGVIEDTEFSLRLLPGTRVFAYGENAPLATVLDLKDSQFAALEDSSDTFTIVDGNAPEFVSESLAWSEERFISQYDGASTGTVCLDIQDNQSSALSAVKIQGRENNDSDVWEKPLLLSGSITDQVGTYCTNIDTNMMSDLYAAQKLKVWAKDKDYNHMYQDISFPRNTIPQIEIQNIPDFVGMDISSDDPQEPSVFISKGDNYDYDIKVTDADGDTLSTAEISSSTGLTLAETETGYILTGAVGEVGQYDFVLQADDTWDIATGAGTWKVDYALAEIEVNGLATQATLDKNGITSVSYSGTISTQYADDMSVTTTSSWVTIDQNKKIFEVSATGNHVITFTAINTQDLFKNGSVEKTLEVLPYVNNAPLMKWSGGEEEYVYIGSDIILSYPFFPASKQSSYNDFDGLAWYSADGDELTPDFTNIPTGVSMVEAGNNIAGYKFTSTGTYVLEVSVSDDYALDSKTTTVTKTIHIVDWMAPDVNVSYSTTEPTNQDVVATITLPDGVTSSNGVVHTFTENGSFDFNLTETATNQSFVVTATVNNIEIIAEGEQEESQDSALVEEVPVEEVPVEEVPVEEVPVEVQLPVVEADVVEESAVDLGSDDIIDETTYEVVKVVQVKNDQEPLAQVVIHTGTIIKKADDNTIYTGALLAPMYIEESTAAELYEEVVENTEIVSVYEVGSETEHFIFENKLYTLTLPTNGSVNPHIYTLSGSDWVIQDTNEVVTEFYISADIEHMSKFAVIADAPEQQEQQPTQINTSGGSSGGGWAGYYATLKEKQETENIATELVETAGGSDENIIEIISLDDLYDHMVSAILTEKDLDHALSIAEDMTEQYPESARAWNGLGWVYLERNELNQAQEALARAESIDPSVAYLSDNKADLAEKQARPTDSVEESHAPQTAGGTDLVEPVETPVIEKSARQVILELQDALLQDSDAIAAIELGIEATEKDATNVETWNALGWAYIEAGRYEDAQISLEKARSIDASFSKIYLNLGNLFRAQEDMEMALSHYRLAIEHEGQVESFVSKEAQKQINRILLSQEKQSSNTGDISQDTGEFVEVTQEDLVEIYEVQEEINIQTIWQIFKQYFESLFGFMR